MSKVIYVLKRSSNISTLESERLDIIAKRLIPDNIANNKITNSKIISGNVASLVINDMGVFPQVDTSLLCGNAVLDKGWEQVGEPIPSGDFAIFRDNDKYFEIASNTVGSRTVWYFLDEDYFITSTSQRAIIMFIGKYKFNNKVIPWVLSSGTLGPKSSWDTRIKRLPPASSLLLKKETWNTSLETNDSTFNATNDKDVLKKNLIEQIDIAVKSLGTTKQGWVLPLSGGYDSRGILCYMSRYPKIFAPIRTITWGVKSEESRANGDAYIAKKLANSLGTMHEFMTTDISDEPAGKILDRFIRCSEGRIDHFGGYADGLQIWSHLHTSGIKGTIRGDEGFGWVPVTSEASVRISNGFGLCSDYENLKNIPHRFELEKQDIPVELQQREHETLETWRDRLYQNFRIPTVLSALSDIKYSYVEQASPLLYDNVIKAVRKVPDELRENKKIFRQIVDEISPNIKYAAVGSNAPLSEILSSTGIADEIKNKLANNTYDNVLPFKLAEDIVKGMEVNVNNSKGIKKLLKFIKRNIPSRWKSRLRDTVAKPKINPFELAFRAYILVSMNEILISDSNVRDRN